jgi:hypothetical protein
MEKIMNDLPALMARLLNAQKLRFGRWVQLPPEEFAKLEKIRNEVWAEAVRSAVAGAKSQRTMH